MSVSALPFEGLRVLDMTTFWAGPSCTHMLAMLGAEVIHVESTRRPDGTRLIAGIPITEDQWWEKSPIFSGLNTNKKGLTLDLQSDAGRELLMRLIATCDVIVENFTPRVVDQIGLDFAAVQAVRPDAIMLRMPGFGLDGPWRDNPAFAYVIEAASGISWLTGYPDRNPYEPYSVGDPNAGVHALNALLLALEHRRRTGQGVLIEAAMVDAALNVAAEQVIEYSAYGALLQRDGNRGPTAAPQNLYRTNEIDEFGRRDCWVAVAVATDEQWNSLCDALERPEWATEFCAPPTVRRAHHDLIDEHLTALVRTAHWRRHRRRPVEPRRTGGQGHAAPPPNRTAAARRPRLLRRRRSSGERPNAAQHPAVHILARAREDPRAARAATRTAQPRGAVRTGPERQGHRRTGGPGRDRHRAGDARHRRSDSLQDVAIDPSNILLTGRVAVVTGGGEGIGRGIAEGLAAFGASVAIWERNAETCAAAAESIGALGIVTDVRDSGQVDAALQRTIERTRRCRRSWSTTPAACSTHRCSTPPRTAGMRSTRATFAMCCCAHSGWRAVWSTAGRPGSVINVTSIEGVRAAPGYAAYAAAKAGVVNYTKTAALELAPHKHPGQRARPGPDPDRGI